MRRLLVVLTVACKSREAPAPPPPPPPPVVDSAIDVAAATRTRNAALATAPTDYQVSAEPCDRAVPSDPRAITTVEVGDLEHAPPTESTTGDELVVVREVIGPSSEIGRIFLWDRAANKFVCANAYNAANVATALRTSKLWKLAPASSSTPVVVDHLPARTGLAVRQVAIGANHFCALVEDGTVRCFGQNDGEQCGKGPTFVARPQKVPGITDGVEIAAGGSFTCARRRGGVVTCWGTNTFGELGAASADISTATLAVGAVQVVAGAFHTCARLADGGVTCWGDSSRTRGEQHDTAEADRDARPRRVAKLGPAVDVCARSLGTCARLRSGGIACWGLRQPVPVQVRDSEHATAMWCDHASDALCWGDDQHHATCTGGDAPALEHVAWIGFGNNHACARHDDGSVECWGHDEYGQLGNGRAIPTPVPWPAHIPTVPYRIPALHDVKQVAVGQDRSAAILGDDALATWGYGPIGDGRACDGPPCDGLVPTVIPIN